MVGATRDGRIIGRYIWGLLGPDDETLVLETGSAEELGELLGLAAPTISLNANRGIRRNKEPYYGCRYVKLPRREQTQAEPELTASKLTEADIHGTLHQEAPCALCVHLRRDGSCTRYNRCRPLRVWVGNKLMVFRLLWDTPEPEVDE